MKKLILMILAIATFTVSCKNSDDNSSKEIPTQEETTVETQQWDSVYIEHGNLENSRVLILYKDGTAKGGSYSEYEKWNLSDGYWEEGYFTRGSTQVGCLKITINAFSLYYDGFHDFIYYISDDRSRVWTANPLINKNPFEAMKANSKDLNTEILKWRVF